MLQAPHNLTIYCRSYTLHKGRTNGREFIMAAVRSRMVGRTVTRGGERWGGGGGGDIPPICHGPQGSCRCGTDPQRCVLQQTERAVSRESRCSHPARVVPLPHSLGGCAGHEPQHADGQD